MSRWLRHSLIIHKDVLLSEKNEYWNINKECESVLTGEYRQM